MALHYYPLMVLLLYHVLPTSSLIQICEKVIDPKAAAVAPHTTRACEKRFWSRKRVDLAKAAAKSTSWTSGCWGSQ